MHNRVKETQPLCLLAKLTFEKYLFQMTAERLQIDGTDEMLRLLAAKDKASDSRSVAVAKLSKALAWFSCACSREKS